MSSPRILLSRILRFFAHFSRTRTELDILSSISHDNIIAPTACAVDTELEMTAFSMPPLDHTPPGTIDYSQMFSQLASGLNAVHSKGVYHGGLKCCHYGFIKGTPVLYGFSNANVLSQVSKSTAHRAYLCVCACVWCLFFDIYSHLALLSFGSIDCTS